MKQALNSLLGQVTASKMYTGNPRMTTQFFGKRALKLHVQNIECFRILVRITYAVDVSNDFPRKRTMVNDGLLLLQDSDEVGCHPSEGK